MIAPVIHLLAAASTCQPLLGCLKVRSYRCIVELAQQAVGPGYEVTGGSATLDGADLLALPTWQRAAAGLFLAFQYPTEVPGVALGEMLEEAFPDGWWPFREWDD